MELAKREMIAKRAAQELKHGDIVNLGIGIPTLVSNYVNSEIKVIFMAENGLIMMGERPEKGKENPDITNAGNIPVTILPGASFLSSEGAFNIIRGGYCDITILGALEVSQEGDLANWIIPGKFTPGMGGGMDLALNSKRVIITTSHVDKNSNSKILKKCRLPLTAKGCIDMIITDMAVLKVREEGLVLVEMFEGYTVDDIKNATEADLIIPQGVKVINL